MASPPDGRYEVDGEDGAYVIGDRRTGDLIGAFYAVDGDPGWWRGTVHGRVRRLFLPLAGPLDVAARLLRP